MRVLIIDDDQAHGESLSDLLNTRGHEAYCAVSLAEAEWLLDLFRFELAILDHDMPDQTGPEVAAQLKLRDPKLQSIVMSARQENEELCDCGEEIGPLPFVPKPISIDYLLNLIRDLTSGTSLILRIAFPVAPYRRRRS